MFALFRAVFPKDELELKAAIGAGFAPLGLDASRVTLEGSLPALTALRCNVSGADFRKEHRFPKVAGVLSPGFFVRDLSVSCENGRFLGAEFSASLRVDDAIVGYGRDLNNEAVLVLEKFVAAALNVSLFRSGIERVLFDLAASAAEEQGAEMKETSLHWEQENSRALRLRIEARAKAMFVDARVTTTARVSIDDDMRLTVSGLSCTGEGMMGNLAATMLRKQIPQYEGRSISLGEALPGGVRMKSIELRCEPEALVIRATA